MESALKVAEKVTEEVAQEEVSLGSLTRAFKDLQDASRMVLQKFAVCLQQKRSHCVNLEQQLHEIQQQLEAARKEVALAEEDELRMRVAAGEDLPVAEEPRHSGVGAEPVQAPTLVKARAKRAGGAAEMPVGERMAAVMTTEGIWKAATVEQALIDAGDPYEGDNVRGYIGTLLKSHTIRWPGPDGQDLRGKDGKIIKIARFRSAGSKTYRLATQEEMEQEVRRLLGESEVIMSETPVQPEEESEKPDKLNFGQQILEDQGIPIGGLGRSALDAVPHK